MDKFSELKAAALAATPGPWESLYDDWSDGDDALISCESRDGMVAIAKIEGGGPDSGFDELFSSEQQANTRYIAAANPAVVLALLAELEAKDDALRAIAFHVSAGGYNADSVDAEVFKQKIIDGIDSISGVLIKRIDELKAIKTAAEKLVRCKGRYHSEQNYRALAALFGVTTPDLPPVEGDSEAVIAELRAKLEELESDNERLLWNGAKLKQQNVKMGERLATPVRLPHFKNDNYHDHVSSDNDLRAGWFQYEKYWHDVERAILAAGFIVTDA